ncbi:hypothetical protein BN7_4881 [Wickerhamomyces ciferrii]|uniref:Uncharacterized protein n=1 Tax=Wickerhamomyces ciferrii (strain ATCC 14091 / BCRC 22168 / CBS 111 / JCM 3599 / NBRC 0793 / NRRL Y-1031 F-60-10) TaxID=1206466 RepID=K0KV47_WICCF|nr:uncharacterized protein BN7_4881 [Wickerhamomyces ciferrii]CCH45299.1 hypothetical protein BN7_4881 [Wickerhamomyces ciferrii]
MSRVFKSFDTEIAENLNSNDKQDKQDQKDKQKTTEQQQQQSQSKKNKSAIKKQTFDELYGEPENFLEIEVSRLIIIIPKLQITKTFTGP